VVQGGLTGKIVSKIGQKNAAKLGLFLSIFVLIGMGLITQGWMMCAIFHRGRHCLTNLYAD
jgi:DHA1 family tetracycline resistance protein-like MFS transporter